MLKRLAEVLRSIAAVALAAFVLLGPGYRQALDGRENLVPQWVMFSGKALGIYGVHFELVRPSGEKETITWGEFDRPPVVGAPVRAARARNLNDIAMQASRICREVGPGTKLFATARLAVREGNGWAQKGDPSLDLCVPRNRSALVRIEQPTSKAKKTRGSKR